MLTQPDEDSDIEYRREVPSEYADAETVVAALITRRGMAAGNGPGFGAKDPEFTFLNQQWQALLESFDDRRFALALTLSNARSDSIVMVDLTDLVLGGYLDIDDTPHLDARKRMAASVAAGGPVIVVAEGPSDARWLRAALDLAAPEVAHLFEFLDFGEFRAPGGTDRVVSLTKGMASAGVMNRVVAVLDNDTAGRIAAKELAQLALPARMTVVTLPRVPHAVVYPTLGPEGASLMDVNGRAASIEFMFGDEVLRDVDGVPFPVRWTAWMPAASDYQGSLDKQHKAIVRVRLDQLLGTKAPRHLPHQVSAGCELLASVLLAAAAPPPHVPASDHSDLTARWRRELLPSTSAPVVER